MMPKYIKLIGTQATALFFSLDAATKYVEEEVQKEMEEIEVQKLALEPKSILGTPRSRVKFGSERPPKQITARSTSGAYTPPFLREIPQPTTEELKEDSKS
jgi:hypothetical protein